jgi:protein SCO1/2
MTQHFGLKTLLIVSLVIGVFVAGYGLGKLLVTLREEDTPQDEITSDVPAEPSGGAWVEPPQQLADFTLTSHMGDPISLSDLRGKAILMFFGYTHCPDVCPTTLADYKLVKRELGAVADKVAFVFVSVDGERDTPEVVADYLSKFDEDFIGMTGDPADLRRIGNAFSLFFSKTVIEVADEHSEGDEAELDQDNYFVEHTSPSFLIDPQGKLQMLYFYGTAPENIAGGILQMLNEPAS